MKNRTKHPNCFQSQLHQRQRRGVSTVWMLLGLAIIAVVAVLAVPSWRTSLFGGSSDSKEYKQFITESVKMAPFRIVVIDQGTLDSMQNSTLTNRVEGSTTILSIVPEGTTVAGPVKTEFAGKVKLGDDASASEKTVVVVEDDGTEHTYSISIGEYTRVIVEDGQRVKKGDILGGDVVCELDSSSLVDKERQQQISVTQSRANYDKAQKELAIQKSTNATALSAAQLAETLADLDNEKYTADDGEYQQEFNRIKGEMKKSEQTLETARESYEYTRTLAQRGYSTQTDLESKRIAVTQASIELQNKSDELNVLKTYTKVRREAELKQDAENKKEDTKRIVLEGEALIAKVSADLDTAKLTYEVEASELERLQRQIKACILVAPQKGEVVYASQQSSRGSQPVVIEEGANVRERQRIVKLPDLTSMKADARIHESKISRIEPGLSVEIEVDALPNVLYHGVLESVSSVPVPGSWPNTDLKEYESVIRITDDVKKVRELRPGMNAELRIIVQERDEDVLQAPVQSIINVMGTTFAYVLTPSGPEKRDVKVGDSNDEFMEIVEGLKAGEDVIMNPRTHFADDISEIEAKLLRDAEENAPKAGKGRPGKGAGSWKGSSKGGAKGKSGGWNGSKGKGAGKGGRPKSGGQQASGGGGQFDPSAIFTRVDKNGDGKITSDEDTSGRMMASDADGDGSVSKEEFLEAAKKWQQR